MDGPPAQEKGPAKSPIEEASREDLVKHVKRQLALLQKQKAKCDELSAKCRAKDEEIETLTTNCESLENVRREHDELREAYLSLQGAQEKQFLSFQALEDQLAVANNDAVKWRRKFQDCLEKLECTESKLTAFAQGTECLNQEMKKLEQENEDLRRKVEELKDAEAEARSIIAAFQQQDKQMTEADSTSVHMQEKVEQLLAEREALTRERDILSGELQTVATEKKEYTEQFLKLLEERSLLENQRDMKVNECNLLQEEKHGLEKQVSELYASKEDLEKNEKQFAKILDENSSLEKSLAEAVAENTELQRTINDLQEKVDKMRTEQEKLQGEVVEANSTEEADKLKLKLADFEGKFSLKVEELEKLESELEVALRQRDEAERLIQNLRSELEANREAARDENEQGDASQRLEELSSEIEELKKQLEAVTAEKDNALTSLRNYQKAETEWKTRQDDLEKGVSCSKKDYDALLESLQRSASHISALEKQLQTSLQEKHNVVEELTQVKDLQQFLEDEAKELHRECDKVKTEAKRLEADLENDHLHIQKLEHELEEAEEREHTSAKDLEALRCIFDDILSCIVEFQEELFTWKMNGIQPNFETLEENSRKIYQLVTAAVESGLADFNIEAFLRPCANVSQCCVDERASVENEQLEMLRREMAALQEELSSSRMTLEQLQLEKKAVEDELEAEKCLKNAANAEIVAKAAAVSSLEGKLMSHMSEYESKVCNLERQIEERASALSAKEDVLNRALEDAEHFRILSGTFEVDNRHLVEEISKLRAESAVQAEAQSALCDRVSRLQKSVKNFSTKRAQLWETHNAMKEETTVELEGFSTVLSTSLQQLDAVLEKVIELEKQCDGLKSENALLVDKNASLKLELMDKQNGCIQADYSITELRKQVSELSTSKQRVDEQLEDVLATLSVKEGDHRSTIERLAELEAFSDSLKVENKHLEAQISQLKSELASRAEETNPELSRQLDSLQTEKAELLEVKAELNRKLEEAQKEIGQLHEDYNQKSALEQSLSHEVSELKSKVSTLTAENLTKANLVEEIHGKLDDLLERSETLRSELEAKTLELDGCKQSLVAERNTVVDLQAELRRIQARLTSALVELETSWKLFFPERDFNAETVSSEMSQIVCSVSQWGKVNEQILHDILSFLEAVLSDYGDKNGVSASIPSKVEEYLAKLENSHGDQADVITSMKVEEVRLCIKILEVIRSLVDAETRSNRSATSESDNKDSEKIAELIASAKDKDEKLNKFKSLVVKLKRELTEKNKQLASYEKEQNGVKVELDKQAQASKQALLNFQSLQKEYDKLQDDNEATKALCKELETKLTSVVNELATLNLQTSAVQAERDKLKQAQDVATAEMKAWEQCKVELEAKLLVAESERSTTKEQNDQLRGQLTPLEDKVAELNQQLQAQKEQYGSAVQELERVQKESKMQSLLHLEMADYERSVAELNSALKDKTKELQSMQEESLAYQTKISSLTEHIQHLEEEKKFDETKISALKETVAGLKEGLGTSRRHEEQLVKAEVRLESDLKAAQLREEEAKLNYAELLRKFQSVETSLRTTRENAQRNSKALESKALLLKEELATTRNELSNTKTEFENYKTRVHTVLKQQKKTTEGSCSSNTEANGKLQQLVEQLRARVQELVEQVEAQRSEAELAQEEYEHLTARHQKVVSELEAREKDWKARLEETIRKNTHEMSVELDKQLKQQHDKLTSTFHKKLAEQAEDHRAVLESQKELIRDLREELKQEQAKTSPPQEDTFDISLQERQEGEGSECATSSTSIPITSFPWEVVPSTGFAPLEQLLHGNSEKDDSQEVLSAKISEAHKKLNHMSELLNESESSNLRMTEQIRVLKEEIRRLERNKEREKHAENLEYLKNIILKFTTLKGGSEKERLIPVLTTMLKLSPEEQKQLQAVVAGSGEVDAAAVGWGGYLPRWPGIV